MTKSERVSVYVKCIHCAINTACKKENNKKQKKNKKTKKQKNKKNKKKQQKKTTTKKQQQLSFPMCPYTEGIQCAINLTDRDKLLNSPIQKKVREKSRECHNHKPQPFPDPKRKRKPTNPNKHKLNKRTKSTKISSLFPKLGNRNTKRTEKHKNKMTHGKTYNKSPRRINPKATKSKTNTGTTALERSKIMIALPKQFGSQGFITVVKVIKI